MAIRWRPALAVGIETIDEQHRELLRRAAAFARGLEGRSRVDELRGDVPL
jgi:hemerythrin